mmetsp:Transcript_11577/g.29722  ORF Transcript_11577/g.29722 Transcript_11577/m.29722 type:complete len:532 (-) Transcript_11577:111-1706(-)|eukprot:CAMPEP_0182950860 /NCGR_PEP_ID=MMETSP0105_2-20130417/60977_1 /TAXON_ID=81532 ORGANISM="Acanthoeca-like sp., Strain 10tr" /NCGR_SAMPLE_ID=MMETSP0105_2 /ASSEMBLY_ACC=CAM_ASM_000205 /LENGTH=531 /DNA_ID=CAMNT_0025091167 /DNA_START=85 /DNA_END=1680 /DNA_ORIENTATION=+
MKLDVELLRYLGADDFRVLHAVEIGMRNHEYVPARMLSSIAGLRRGGAHKVLKDLVRHKLLGYNNRKGEGYRLTTSGYDFLALRAMAARESIASVGNQIGVGKESDIYIVANGDEEQLALKLHRLGRSSFRTIKKNRDYHRGRKHVSWLYLAALAAKKEFAYMQVLYDHGFPVPRPVDSNRCAIVMELLDATPLHIVKKMEKPDEVYAQLMEVLVRLANYGLVHCDFNEFNLLISRDGKITLIDFPQMVSTDHANAQFFFDRDVDCIRTFFSRRFDFEAKNYPRFDEVVRTHSLDVEVAASGFDKTHEQEFAAMQADLVELTTDAHGVDKDEDDGGSDLDDQEPPVSADDVEDKTTADGSGQMYYTVSAAASGLTEAVEELPSPAAAPAPATPDAGFMTPLAFGDDDALARGGDNFGDVSEVAKDSCGDHAEKGIDDDGSDTDDGDAALRGLETGNREYRAFRNPERRAVEEEGAKPSLDAAAIRDKVRKSIACQQKSAAHNRSKKKGGKVKVSRAEKKERKGKSATKIDY